MSEAGGRNGNQPDNQLRLESINRANGGAGTNQGILVERFIRSRDAEIFLSCSGGGQVVELDRREKKRSSYSRAEPIMPR
jgi:hypothetical protein